ncbi:MAG TPA: DUF885 domain-containing protein [Bryobacteraceae bacterium]|nr:DUF885 domain-containing protein [Bryobacteraceae bacterium]
MKQAILGFSLAFATFGQTPAPATNIDDFFRDFTAQWVRADPNLAASTRYFTGEEQDRFERQLTPETMTHKRERIRLARQGLAELAKFDRSKMTDGQRLSADVMQWQLETVVGEEPFLDYTFPLEQMNGVNIRLVETMTVRHPVLTEKDAVNYIAALGQVSARMQEAIAESRAQAALGFIPPAFILAATLKQMQGFVDAPPAQNPFVTAFAQKLAAISSMPAARREELRAEAEKIAAAQIYPAWKKAIALLSSQQKRAGADAGLWRFKDGADAYAYFRHRYTTTNLAAARIHQIGLDQVTRIESEMDTLLRRLGRTAGPVKERIAKLAEDMRYPNPTSEASRDLIMQDIEKILRDAEARSALLFDIRPKSPVVAQPFPSFREANAAANYNVPAPDGSRPGTFQFPRRPEMMTRFGLRSIVYHETVPGHHFQIALEVEDKNLPRFRQIRALGGISAFTEGWGLYAERLAAESGWYGDDVEGLLGELNYELFRARRLVVDTGIHSMHWTRQQGIDFGIEASEVERYVVFPGQACSYMMGELKIVELREKARQALGDKFSLREFHNVVFRTGSVPLDILERQVDAWIRSQGGKV